jgi:hypothetical protein
MESKFQTSFIPKTSLNESSGTRVKTPLNILFLIAVILTIAAVVGAAGMFGFKYLIQTNIEAKRAELVEKEKTFDYTSMNDVVRIDKKLKAAEGLINNHIAVSNLFSLLEENTLRNLRFTSFDFNYIAKDKIAVTMKGEARNFGVVAKQTEAFSKMAGVKGFSDSIFSELNVNENGNVVFSFLTNINPTIVSYVNNLPNALPATQPSADASTEASVQAAPNVDTNTQ